MFEFTFGDIGSGKSMRQAKRVLALLERSVRIEKLFKGKKGSESMTFPREVWCNFHMSKKIQEKYQGRLHYWHIPQEMIFKDFPLNKELRKDFDCVWDEMAVELPSDKWKDTDPAIRYFFAQHRKRGIEIYGNTQDFMMLDINARRMATSVFKTSKVIGNRDPSSTRPPLKVLWGLIVAWKLDKALIRETGDKIKHVDILPEFIWITKDLCSVYDTSEDVKKAEKNRLLHIEYWCDKCKRYQYDHIKV